MKQSFTGKWLPPVVPLAAAVLLSQGCSDDGKQGADSLAQRADAGNSTASKRASSDKAGSESVEGAAKASTDERESKSDSERSQDKARSDPSGDAQSDASGDAQSNTDADGAQDQPKVDLAASKLGSAGSFVDFDGDSRRDQLLGAPHAKRDGRLGVALVYAGKDDGWSQRPTATLTGGRDFGYAVAEVGDVDGDGKRDYAVGAPHGDGDDISLTGSVSVFAGGSKGKLLAKLAGTASASKFGFAVAGGDFNGDGHADVVVGAPFHTPSSALYQTGAVFVHLGPRLDKVHVLTSIAEVKGLGWAVAAGDLNGDDIDDLAISATSIAQVMVFFGRPEFRPSLAVPDMVLTSKASGFGKTLAVVPDFSGDGHHELAIAAPTAVVGADRDVGRVFLVTAQRSAAPIDLDATPAVSQRFLQLDGPGLFSRFGAAIATAPDTDGDGTPELVIGAPMADDQVNDMVGKLFVFASQDLAAQHAGRAKSFAGSKPFGSFGAFVAPGERGRVLVGAPRGDADRGGAHVVDVREGMDARFEPTPSDADAGMGMEGEHDDHH